MHDRIKGITGSAAQPGHGAKEERKNENGGGRKGDPTSAQCLDTKIENHE